MRTFFTKQLATNGLLAVLSLMVLIHLLILIGVIPYEMIWGGRLKDDSQMLVFEGVSITVNLIMLAVVAIYAGILKVNINRTILKGALWIMFVLFLLNTIGNLFSENDIEKILFTPLTIFLSIFSFRLAVSKELKNSF